MVIDKIKKFNDTDKSNSEKNEKASEMLIGKWVKCDSVKKYYIKKMFIKIIVYVLIVVSILEFLPEED